MILSQQFCVTAPVVGVSLDASFVQNVDCYAVVENAQTVAIGDIVSFVGNPITVSATSVDDPNPSAYINSTSVVTPTINFATGNSATRRFNGVAMEGGVAGVKIKVRLRGICYAKTNTSTSIGYGGGMLVVGASASLVNTPGTPAALNAAMRQAVALPLAATGTSSQRTLVLFDGMFGFGSYML